MEREDITKCEAAVLECAGLTALFLCTAGTPLMRSGRGKSSKELQSGVKPPHSKFGTTRYDSLESSFRSNGPANFIARRVDGDDHARGFDFSQRHDDPFDFDTVGTSRRPNA